MKIVGLMLATILMFEFGYAQTTPAAKTEAKADAKAPMVDALTSAQLQALQAKRTALEAKAETLQLQFKTQLTDLQTQYNSLTEQLNAMKQVTLDNLKVDKNKFDIDLDTGKLVEKPAPVPATPPASSQSGK